MRIIRKPGIDIVALFEESISVAVEKTLERTTSPYVGAAELDDNLKELRHNVGRLAMARPDRFATLAAHLDVPATGFHVLAAVDARAHQLLEDRYAEGPPRFLRLRNMVLGIDPPDQGRLDASTREQRRTPPPGGPDRGRGMTR